MVRFGSEGAPSLPWSRLARVNNLEVKGGGELEGRAESVLVFPFCKFVGRALVTVSLEPRRHCPKAQ